MTRPFDAAPAYRANGWLGTLPLPLGKKREPRTGYTGASGGWPTEETVYGWLHTGGNIALRLPETIIGIDVDDYDAKRGGDTLRDLEGRWGPLPSTWVSTSREKGVSGIRLFTIPAGVESRLVDPGQDIETIKFGHRYIVAAPSLHPEGRRYRWVRPDGSDAAEGEYPSVDEIVDLPATWVDGLSTARTEPGDVAVDELPDQLSTHKQIVRLAAKLRFKSLDADAIAAELLTRLIDGRIFASRPDVPWTPQHLKKIAADIGNKPQNGLPPPITITGTAPADEEAGTGGARWHAVPPAHLTRQSRAAWYFAKLAGNRVRFDHGRGRWLVWAGHRWRPDEDGSVSRLWLNVLGKRYAEAMKSTDDATRLRMTGSVQAAGATNSSVMAGLTLASSMEPIATTADAWDTDPWVLCCKNGVVDLRSGELRAGRPEEMISRSTGVAYDPDAACPRWERFLNEVFAGDVELVDWYQMLIGTSLVGEAQEVLAIHHGFGNNGKSVAVLVLRRAFGDYAAVIAVETLMNAKRAAGDATPDLMALRGARIAFTSEPDQAAKLRGGVLKRLASVDRMTGRSLYGTTQTWDPTHTMHLATNHLPAVDDATDGFWRRVALIPWAVRFRKPGEDGDASPEDPTLAATLALEAPGILAWAVRGAVAYASGRMLHPFPKAVRVRTNTYRAEEDKLAPFVADRVVYDRGESVTVGALFAAYREWCEATAVPSYERLSRKALSRQFEERGHGVGRGVDTTKRVILTGARLTASTNPEYPEYPTPFAGSPHASSDFGKVRQQALNTPDTPETGVGRPVDLHAEAIRIFGDDLVDPSSVLA